MTNESKTKDRIVLELVVPIIQKLSPKRKVKEICKKVMDGETLDEYSTDDLTSVFADEDFEKYVNSIKKNINNKFYRDAKKELKFMREDLELFRSSLDEHARREVKQEDIMAAVIESLDQFIETEFK